MTISAQTIWEIRTGGSTTNGGGADPSLSGKDVSAATDLAIDSTNPLKVTSATHNFTSSDNHKYIHITAGTGFHVGWYQIESTSGNAAFLQSAPGKVGSTAGTYDLHQCIDYGYQTAANSSGSNISTTDAVANGTTTITSATASFTNNVVGNIVYFAGGSGSITAVRRQVTAFTNSTTITIDASIASSTGMTMNIGGALESPGTAGSVMVSGNYCFIQSGTYSITSASSNVAGGCVTLPTGSSASQITKLQGYGSQRYDYGTKPLLQASGISTFTIITSQNMNRIENLSLDGASLTSSRGLNVSSRAQTYNCKFANFTNSGIAGSGGNLVVACEATGCSTVAAFLSCSFYGCVAHGNTFTGFQSSAGSCAFTRCISVGNTGASSDGFFANADNTNLVNCTSYGNGRDGFRFTSGVSDVNTAINCVAEGNTGTGFNLSAADDQIILINCAAYNNTAANFSTSFAGYNQYGSIRPTASVFVNAGSNNFALNGTANAGALLRAAGIVQTPAGLSTSSYPDVGAVQSRQNGIFSVG